MDDAKRVTVRVRNAFSGDEAPPEELSLQFIDMLLTNWREAEKSITRIAGISLVTAISFELLSRQSIGELSLAFIKITNYSAILPFIPVVVAYLFLQYILAFTEATLYHDCFSAVIIARYPHLAKDDVHLLAGPPLSLVAGVSRGISWTYASGSGAIPFIRLIVQAAWPIAFSIYAYVRMVTVDGLMGVTLWLSVALSLLLFSVGLYSLYRNVRAVLGNSAA